MFSVGVRDSSINLTPKRHHRNKCQSVLLPWILGFIIYMDVRIMMWTACSEQQQLSFFLTKLY